MRKGIIIIVLLLILISSGCIQESQMPVVCTEEAKVCPDGSSVGRVSPDCEFAPCPTTPPTTTPAPTTTIPPKTTPAPVITTNPPTTIPPTTEPPNNPPIAVAKNINAVYFDNINLDASESRDEDGSIVEYKWTISGEELTSENLSIEYLPEEIGKISGELTVVDDKGAVSTTEFFVEVNLPEDLNKLYEKDPELAKELAKVYKGNEEAINFVVDAILKDDIIDNDDKEFTRLFISNTPQVYQTVKQLVEPTIDGNPKEWEYYVIPVNKFTETHELHEYLKWNYRLKGVLITESEYTGEKTVFGLMDDDFLYIIVDFFDESKTEEWQQGLLTDRWYAYEIDVESAKGAESLVVHTDEFDWSSYDNSDWKKLYTKWGKIGLWSGSSTRQNAYEGRISLEKIGNPDRVRIKSIYEMPWSYRFGPEAVTYDDYWVKVRTPLNIEPFELERHDYKLDTKKIAEKITWNNEDSDGDGWLNKEEEEMGSDPEQYNKSVELKSKYISYFPIEQHLMIDDRIFVQYFEPPVTPIKLDKISFATRADNDETPLEIEVWDEMNNVLSKSVFSSSQLPKDLDPTIHEGNNPYYPQNFFWAELDIPDSTINSSFAVALYSANLSSDSGIHIDTTGAPVESSDEWYAKLLHLDKSELGDDELADATNKYFGTYSEFMPSRNWMIKPIVSKP